jgi:integrase
VLTPEEAWLLLDSIGVTELCGLRDRALLAMMVYSFARVSAVVGMNVDDYYQQGKRWWLRLHEKGGKHHEVPAHTTPRNISMPIFTPSAAATDGLRSCWLKRCWTTRRSRTCSEKTARA